MFRRYCLRGLYLILIAGFLAACSTLDRVEYFDPDIFSNAATFTPVDQLQLTESDFSVLNLDAANQFLKTVSVSRDGKVSYEELNALDLQALSTAQELIEEGFSPDNATGNLDLSLDDELGIQSVIGADGRIQVTATTTYPYRVIGRIALGCTGTLVGPRHVLTAGHCVYNTKTNKWYSNLNFTPGQNGSTKPYGTKTWTKAITVTGWTVNKSKNHDYAMIILSSNIGNTVGWLGYGWQNPLPLYNVNMAGYPGDKTTGTMWRSYCKIAVVQTNRFFYPCDTYNGMSGSGVYVYNAAANTRIIYGIHAYGVGGSYPGSSYNSATRITQTKFNKIKDWVATN